MASGEAGGKKRKASVAEDVTSPARREPRRGLGVAELERIRVALEMAERCCYAAVASSWSLSTPHQPPRPALPPAAAALVVHHAAGVAAAPAAHHQHQHVRACRCSSLPSCSRFLIRIYRLEIMELFINCKWQEGI